MKMINTSAITCAVKKMCIESNIILPVDVYDKLTEAKASEASPIGQGILSDIITNADIAKTDAVPMCQDTGMAVFFVAIGQNVKIEGGTLTEAINQGVREGYAEGYLRKSVVKDPLNRQNTGDNTPAIIHYDIVEGDALSIEFAPKGFGSENMSQTKMLKPSDGEAGVIEFVKQVVSEAGPNPCPPIVVGVGIGGTIEKATQMAKHALFRPLNQCHSDTYYANLEHKLLTQINALGIGPQGLGGNTTALSVAIEAFPTHIAGLPVAVNINCHADRHQRIVL